MEGNRNIKMAPPVRHVFIKNKVVPGIKGYYLSSTFMF